MELPMFYAQRNPQLMMGGGMNSYMQGYMAAIQMMEMMQIARMMMQMQGGGASMYGMGPQGFPGGTVMNEGLGMYLGSQGRMPFSPMPWGQCSPYFPMGGAQGNSCQAMPQSYCPGGGGNASSAVALGERFLGQNSINVRGQLPHFTAAGGQTNNCADFVSSCLESTGQLSGHHVGVSDLEQSLIKQGYHQVPASMAKPGDVYMTAERSHTELVAAPGATRLLGSNNDMPGHQVISEKAHNPASGIYYSRG